ncbi:MAG: antibiotic biosynthesis monooxygenase [Actinomycetota bacterium]
MFVVIHRMHVKTDRRQRFVACWRTVAEALEEDCGGLGSRLHVADDGTYIAYSRWPDRETWENCETPARYAAVNNTMHEACETMEVLYELETVTDIPGFDGET